MKIVVAPRLLIKSSQPKLDRLALFGGTVDFQHQARPSNLLLSLQPKSARERSSGADIGLVQ